MISLLPSQVTKICITAWHQSQKKIKIKPNGLVPTVQPWMKKRSMRKKLELIMKYRLSRFVLLGLAVLGLLVSRGYAQESTDASTPSEEIKQLTLAKAAMCEGITDYKPENPGIVFPTAIGKILCFTLFDPVPQKTVIYHNWYRNDDLVTKVKLTIKPPRWSTFSSIQLREADKGPWRVEITDQKDRVHKILRFSVTD
jgi:hypothetical protein